MLSNAKIKYYENKYQRSLAALFNKIQQDDLPET
jgi:hypothetical protein